MREELGLTHFERPFLGAHHYSCLLMLAYRFHVLEQLQE